MTRRVGEIRSNNIEDYKKSMIDITGNKYGMLTALYPSHVTGDTKPKSFWVFRCKCGTEKIIRKDGVIGGSVISCGCYNKKQNAYKIKHGHTINHNREKPSREYVSWAAMKRRCTNPSAHNYHLYGGRGIKICKRWLNSFENFLQDMGKRPKNKTLDRINVNADYKPSNCRWATYKQQANNRRNSKK